MALWRLSDHEAVLQLFFKNISAIFVNMQSDLSSVAVSVNILTSFTVYTAALHVLMQILFYLLISGLGYPGRIVFQPLKHFHLQKQAAGNPTPAASTRRGTNTVLKSLQNFLGGLDRQQPMFSVKPAVEMLNLQAPLVIQIQSL